MDKKPHPRFDGYECIVTGCERVDYRHGLCRKHWYEAPRSLRIQVSYDVMTAAHNAARKHDAVFARWARNYHVRNG